MLKTIKKKCENKNVLISGCIAGEPCRYNGIPARQQFDKKIIKYLKLNPILVCPEQLGGLTTPRDKAEIINNDGFGVIEGKAKVKTENGQDVTSQYIIGAKETLEIAQNANTKLFITQRKSPSCSCMMIYDGTFTRTTKEGMGVTTALLKKNRVDVIESETLIKLLFEDSILNILTLISSQKTWSECQQDAKKLLQEWLTRSCLSQYEDIFREQFIKIIPKLHGTPTDFETSDSETVRFFVELFRSAFDFEIMSATRRCKICTYPEGFLDIFIYEDGICSACKTYNQNKDIFEDKKSLRASLKKKIDEIKNYNKIKFNDKYDAIIAYSGGKDSVYMMYQLHQEYNLKLLCVMDLLNQQNELAMENAKISANSVNADILYLDDLPLAKNIRSNFMLAGDHFCRLCLRSHFVRIYKVALEKKIPLVFFGLTPYQCLDCVDSINYSLQAIKDVKTPFDKLNNLEILMRYKHRSFQGGYDIGFQKEEEKKLYHEWTSVFDNAESNFTPLMIPFFLFDEYPGEDEIVKIISEKTGWQKPEIIIHHTNCRMLPFAGIYRIAISEHHPNYWVRATELRMKGKIIGDNEIENIINDFEQIEDNEHVSKSEFGKFIKEEFDLSIDKLPDLVRNNLNNLLG
ncbi:MAG: 2-thiouracil desulfurase family protein [Candidatus Hodarchaeota archaeon]